MPLISSSFITHRVEGPTSCAIFRAISITVTFLIPFNISSRRTSVDSALCNVRKYNCSGEMAPLDASQIAVSRPTDPPPTMTTSLPVWNLSAKHVPCLINVGGFHSVYEWLEWRRSSGYNYYVRLLFGNNVRRDFDAKS